MSAIVEQRVTAACGCEMNVDLVIRPGDPTDARTPAKPVATRITISWPCHQHGAGKGYQ